MFIYSLGVYAVIDLYGQCAQVTINGGSSVELSVCETGVSATRTLEQSVISTRSTGIVVHCFSFLSTSQLGF